MDPSPYRKDYWAMMMVARDLIGLPPGSKIPTINDYTERLKISRGIVQSALRGLEERGAIQLEKRGVMGTFLVKAVQPELYDLADIKFITGSMPTPAGDYFAGLATGICQAMANCPVPFNFAFVQGSEKRIQALRRGIYDFVVVTQAAAKRYMVLYPELEIVCMLTKSCYSPPYMLYCNRPGVQEIEDGFSIAADPNSADQWLLTGQVCAGKNVRIVTQPYIATRAAFLAGKVDCVVWRSDATFAAAKGVEEISLGKLGDDSFQYPVIMANRENHGMDKILLAYMDEELIAEVQKNVCSGLMEPAFY